LVTCAPMKLCALEWHDAEAGRLDAIAAPFKEAASAVDELFAGGITDAEAEALSERAFYCSARSVCRSGLQVCAAQPCRARDPQTGEGASATASCPRRGRWSILRMITFVAGRNASPARKILLSHGPLRAQNASGEFGTQQGREETSLFRHRGARCDRRRKTRKIAPPQGVRVNALSSFRAVPKVPS
jgi:hypothetical protein